MLYVIFNISTILMCFTNNVINMLSFFVHSNFISYLKQFIYLFHFIKILSNINYDKIQTGSPNLNKDVNLF